MVFRYFIYVFFVFLVVLGTPAEAAEKCINIPEAILDLTRPVLGSSTSWDVAYGRKNRKVIIQSGIPLGDDTVMTMGQAMKQGTDDHEPLETFVTKLNWRGRALLEEDFPVKHDDRAVAMLKFSDQYVMAFNAKNAKSGTPEGELVWMDKDAKVKSRKTISMSDSDVSVTNIVKTYDQSGFIVILRVVPHQDKLASYSQLIEYKSDGKKIWERSYRIGIEHEIYNVAPLDKDVLIAVGSIVMDDGRTGGWAMKLRDKGGMVWQKVYPRGKSALISHVVPGALKGPGEMEFVMAGEVEPLDESGTSSWIITVNPSGEPIWHRFIRRVRFNIHTKWLDVDHDQRIHLGLSALAHRDSDGSLTTAMKNKDKDHLRLITMSSYGTIITDEGYSKGNGVQLQSITFDENEQRIVSATALAKYHAEKEGSLLETYLERFDYNVDLNVQQIFPEDPKTPVPQSLSDFDYEDKRTVQQVGWIFVTPPVPFHEDPCLDYDR